MARLILDENGKRRAFKLNNGRLTLGSGQGNSLVLVSPDVAEVHAELRVEEGTVTLVPKTGVMPPTLLGRPVKQPTRLAANAEFKIGGALFRIVSDDQSESAAPKRDSASPQGRGRPASVTRDSNGIQRQKRTIKRGMPTWGIFAIVFGICLLGYFLGTNWLEDGLETEWDPGARYQEAYSAYNQGSTKRASEELDRIEFERATPELKARVLELRAKIDEDYERALLGEHNMKGTSWLDNNLKGYAKSFLSGDRAERPRARYFIKRCLEFKKQWPQHPEIGWVNRYQVRFEKIAEMNSPTQYADIEWEVKRRTAAKPRDYALVFRLLDEFIAKAPGEDKVAAQALYQEQIAGREEYFLDRMLQSRYHWERKEYGNAVEWLVQVILKIGDPEMEKQAIDYFLKMQTSTGEMLSARYLESYKNNRPDQFKILMEHSRMREAADSAGIL